MVALILEKYIFGNTKIFAPAANLKYEILIKLNTKVGAVELETDKLGKFVLVRAKIKSFQGYSRMGASFQS